MNGYQSSVRKSNSCTAFSGHEFGHPGEVVGSFSNGAVVNAKPVDASRLSFPAEVPAFDPSKLFSGQHETVFRDPVSLAREPDPDRDDPPRVRVHGTEAAALGLFKFLDQHHRLRLVPESKVRRNFLCGAFTLTKNHEQDRLILDARAPNMLEETLRTWVKSLGAVSSLLQLEVPADRKLLMSGTDLRDYYYCFRVSKRRTKRNCFQFPMSKRVAREFGCFPKELDDSACEETWYPALATLAMGDNNAVELGQGAHLLLGLKAGAVFPQELLALNSRAPRGELAVGIIIDDITFLDQVPKEISPELFTEGQKRLAKICEEYVQEGLTAHPKKTFIRQSQAEFWGVSVDGDKGTVRTACSKLVPLIEMTMRTALLGLATIKLLQILTGSWVAVLQCRKRMMVLLDELYVVQHGRQDTDVVALSPQLKDEMWSLCILGPLAVSDLRAATISQVFCSDASEEFKATVVGDVSFCFARELHRHSLVRGAWTHLLSPWKLWCKQHGELFLGEELPEGVPLVSHPLWLTLAETLEFRVLKRKEVKKKRHINLLEMESILETEEKLAESHENFRYLLAADSQVSLGAGLS